MCTKACVAGVRPKACLLFVQYIGSLLPSRHCALLTVPDDTIGSIVFCNGMAVCGKLFCIFQHRDLSYLNKVISRTKGTGPGMCE